MPESNVVPMNTSVVLFTLTADGTIENIAAKSIELN
jgi:hypothetical protein